MPLSAVLRRSHLSMALGKPNRLSVLLVREQAHSSANSCRKNGESSNYRCFTTAGGGVGLSIHRQALPCACQCGAKLRRFALTWLPSQNKNLLEQTIAATPINFGVDARAHSQNLFGGLPCSRFRLVCNTTLYTGKYMCSERATKLFASALLGTSY